MKGKSVCRDLFRRLGHAKAGIVGLAMVSLMVAMALFAPLISPSDPLEQDLHTRLRPPFWDEKSDPKYMMGTDQVGRDMLSRLIYGSRISLSVGFLTMAFS
ncbi:MAG TPA: ABC transporter permease, partial [Syntrophobacteria bacterium]|nr:ABC transporter permease [Syntrophobacteria bacterium]